jgi:hypothetical protein
MRPRNRLLVDPAVQYSIGLRIVLHWFLFICSLVMSSVAIRIITLAGDVPFSDALTIAVKAQIPVIVIAVLLIPVFLRDTLRLSNRFAGPMFRLRHAIENLKNGNENSPLVFRKNDFWQPVASDFNLVVNEVESLRARNRELETELESLRTHSALNV